MDKLYVGALIIASLFMTPASAQTANSAQEQIERTIGSLFITNTTLQAQLAVAQKKIADLEKELAEKTKIEKK